MNEKNNQDKTTLVLGASEDPNRYSNRAMLMLQEHEIPVIAVGRKEGKVNGMAIQTEIPENLQVDTVTMYLSPKNQEQWIPTILKMNPRRIIFNPGSENPNLEEKAEKAGISTEIACTLVLLSTGGF